jgi:hypothetical protein
MYNQQKETLDRDDCIYNLGMRREMMQPSIDYRQDGLDLPKLKSPLPLRSTGIDQLAPDVDPAKLLCLALNEFVVVDRDIEPFANKESRFALFAGDLSASKTLLAPRS